VKRHPLVWRNFLRGEIKDKVVSVYDCAYLCDLYQSIAIRNHGDLVITQLRHAIAAGSLRTISIIRKRVQTGDIGNGFGLFNAEQAMPWGPKSMIDVRASS
jgi:hypothetical protein